MDSQTSIDPKTIKTKYGEVLQNMLEQFEENLSKQIPTWNKSDYTSNIPIKQFEKILQMKYQNRIPRTVLVILADMSSSMAGERIEGIKKALDFYLNTQDTYDKVAIYGFNSKLVKIQALEENRLTIQEKIFDFIKTDGKAGILNASLELLDDMNKWLDTEENKKVPQIFRSNVAFQWLIVTAVPAKELYDGPDQLNSDWNVVRKKMETLSQRIRGLFFTKILCCTSDDDSVRALSKAFENEVLRIQPTDIPVHFDKIYNWQEVWNKKRRQFNSILDQNLFHAEAIDFIRSLEITTAMMDKVYNNLILKETLTSDQQLEKNPLTNEKRRKIIITIFQESFLERSSLLEEHELRANSYFEKNRALIRDAVKESIKAENLSERIRIKEQLRCKQIDQNEVLNVIDQLKKNYAASLKKSILLIPSLLVDISQI